ncbi:MAG: serine/threonine protein kinase [Rhodoferax sp.]|nr:serine/threonine protein kinase [Rhodoferax sp.]
MAHPEQLGKYTIKTLLGEGAMGVVYKAFDPGIGRLVAIKTIRRALSQDRHAETSLADRFRNEARAVGRLTHPGIVAIYELGQDGDNAFIAMEYVEGRDLSQILTATPILPEPDVQQVMCQLLAALECAHQQGVWHRDIKPANLIISTAGQLKVTDFGIARIESAALTQVSSTIGTPGYMAPEQYTGDRIDHRVDIFASGVLLYRMLSGQAPFTGSPEAVMYGIMAREPVPLAQFAAADIASFYAPIIARAMAKDPAQRFPSAATFRAALQSRTFAVEDATGEIRLMTSPVASPASRPIADPTGLPSALHPAPVTHWEESTLAKVQSALTRFMGPMARVQVRLAAKKCTNLPDLLSLLSQDITNPQDRASFLETLQTRPVDRALSIAMTDIGSLALAGVPGPPTLPAMLVERATLVMTRLMGPIAKIVVKKAVSRAQSPQQFLALLAQELPEGPKRALLITELL